MARQTKLATAPAESLLLNVSQAAAYIGCPPRFLKEQVWQNRIQYVRLGRRLYFSRTDLNEFIEQHRVPARAPARVPRDGRARRQK